VPEVRDDPGEEVEQFLGVLLLPVGELADSGIPYQSGAARFKDAATAGLASMQGRAKMSSPGVARRVAAGW
jgi:hypothetical protein